MKKLTKLLLLAGGALAAQIAVTPGFAHELTAGLRQAGPGVLKDKHGDLNHETLKKFVSDALDAHKSNATKEMRGNFDEMKRYVESALDAENAVGKKPISFDGYLDTLKQGILKVVSASFDSLYIHWVNTAPCFIKLPDSDNQENLKAMKQCLETVIKPDTPATLSNACMAETCQDYPKLREACVMIADIMGKNDSIQDCLAISPTNEYEHNIDTGIAIDRRMGR